MTDRFLVGDVVTLRDRIQLMSVEAVSHEGSKWSLMCSWFGSEEALKFGSFSEEDVDLFPRGMAEPCISTGTEVRLRSRGPVMTVAEILFDGIANFATCVWTAPNGMERKRKFPVEVLALSLFERFQLANGSEV